MHRNTWRDLGPNLLLAAGILAATMAADLSGEAAWLAGPVTLALAVVAADTLHHRLRGAAARPSRAGLALAGIIVSIGAIVAQKDAGSLPTLITTLGIAAWVALPLRPTGRCPPAKPHQSLPK